MNDFWHGLPEQEPDFPEHPPIPEVREHMARLAKGLRSGRVKPVDAAAEIERFIAWLWRRPAIRRAPPDSKPVTPALRQRIIELDREHPEWTEERIAEEVGVKNQGRVSEVLAGYRR